MQQKTQKSQLSQKSISSSASFASEKNDGTSLNDVSKTDNSKAKHSKNFNQFESIRGNSDMNLNYEDKNDIQLLEDLNKLIDNKQKEIIPSLPKPFRLLKLGTSIAP